VDALKNGDEDVANMREAYNQRRRFLVHSFKEMGLECFEPFGAFYIFPCIKEFGMTSDEFATRFLEEEKVAVVPGTAFGDCGEGFVRVSYSYSIKHLKDYQIVSLFQMMELFYLQQTLKNTTNKWKCS
jgi:aminotransferase